METEVVELEDVKAPVREPKLSVPLVVYENHNQRGKGFKLSLFGDRAELETFFSIYGKLTTKKEQELEPYKVKTILDYILGSGFLSMDHQKRGGIFTRNSPYKDIRTLKLNLGEAVNKGIIPPREFIRLRHSDLTDYDFEKESKTVKTTGYLFLGDYDKLFTGLDKIIDKIFEIDLQYSF